jgi:hypothetical protein
MEAAAEKGDEGTNGAAGHERSGSAAAAAGGVSGDQGCGVGRGFGGSGVRTRPAGSCARGFL